MTSTPKTYNLPELKDYDLNRGNKRYILKYAELFGNIEIFTDARRQSKGGKFEGWTDNLLNPRQAYSSLRVQKNIGIKLGHKTERGYTVCFDREHGGSLPEEAQKFLESNAVAIWKSPHDGRNYLLTVSENALNELRGYKQEVYITGGENHDLEILKSLHALIPPSTIDHTECDESKNGCDGSGKGEYELVTTNPEAPTVDLDSIKQLVDRLPVSEKNESDRSNQSEKTSRASEIDTLPESFDHIEYFENNIPGNDSYLERLNTMLQNEEVAELWHGNYEDRSRGELQLRSYVAWYFNADRKMVQYIFEEELPNWREEPLKYELNKHHAKDVITDIGDYINRPYYTTAISFNLKDQLASKIHQYETVTATKIYNDGLLNTDTRELYKQRTIRRGLQTLEELGLITRKSKTEYENKRIDDQYLEELEKMNHNPDYKPIAYPCER